VTRFEYLHGIGSRRKHSLVKINFVGGAGADTREGAKLFNLTSMTLQRRAAESSSNSSSLDDGDVEALIGKIAFPSFPADDSRL
jgi:hypothetical protein